MWNIDPAAYVNVEFTEVSWPNGLPSKFSKRVRLEFLLGRDGKLFRHNDLKDILHAWLYDEFKVCPLSFDFCIVL